MTAFTTTVPHTYDTEAIPLDPPCPGFICIENGRTFCSVCDQDISPSMSDYSEAHMLRQIDTSEEE